MEQKYYERAYKKYKKEYPKSYLQYNIDEIIKDKERVKNILENKIFEAERALWVRELSIADCLLNEWKVKVLNNEIVNYMDDLQESLIYRFYGDMQTNEPYESDSRLFAFLLIFFSVFEWEKEEKIVLKDLNERFKTGTMSDLSLWGVSFSSEIDFFLLELYLDYRNETICGYRNNLIDNLATMIKGNRWSDISSKERDEYYSVAIQRWRTTDVEEIGEIINNLLDLRGEILCGQYLRSSEMADHRFAFFPLDVQLILYYREQLGLENPSPSVYENHFIMQTPEGKFRFSKQEYPKIDELLIGVDKFYKELDIKKYRGNVKYKLQDEKNLFGMGE